jgi:hypothetical protein
MNWTADWIRALVAIGVGAVGAVLTGLVTAYAARQKVREVELNYEYKLRDGYLENARKMTAEVYVPIAVALTELQTAFETFLFVLTYDAFPVPAHEGAFGDACLSYARTIDELFARGADIYLTIELDLRLNKFTNFIRNSVTETVSEKKVRKRITVSSIIQNRWLPWRPQFSYTGDKKNLSGRHRIPNVSFRLPGFLSFTYVEEVLAAPLSSPEFQEVIQTSIPQLKALIKEVTLGSRSNA